MTEAELRAVVVAALSSEPGSIHSVAEHLAESLPEDALRAAAREVLAGYVFRVKREEDVVRPESLTRGLRRSDHLCECGCGERTNISPRNNRAKGWVAGQPRRFVQGHHAAALAPVRYIVDPESGCWIWVRQDKDGYGRMEVGRRRYRAHRWFYEEHVGPIPPGLDLHHRCENRLCVNPDHLEPLTRREHMQRHRKASRAAR